MKDPDLLSCLVFCRHCGIRFLTHPRNAGREDLHCPFGCRLHRRRECARRRSQARYQKKNGYKAKKLLNSRRSCPVQEAPRHDASPCHSEPVNSEPVNSEPVNVEPVNSESHADTHSITFPTPPTVPFRVAISVAGVTLDEDDVKSSSALSYVRMLLRILEELPLRQNELVEWLLQCLRSRSIGRRNRKTYALGFLNEHPP